MAITTTVDSKFPPLLSIIGNNSNQTTATTADLLDRTTGSLSDIVALHLCACSQSTFLQNRTVQCLTKDSTVHILRNDAASAYKLNNSLDVLLLATMEYKRREKGRKFSWCIWSTSNGETSSMIKIDRVEAMTLRFILSPEAANDKTEGYLVASPIIEGTPNNSTSIYKLKDNHKANPASTAALLITSSNHDEPFIPPNQDGFDGNDKVLLALTEIRVAVIARNYARRISLSQGDQSQQLLNATSGIHHGFQRSVLRYQQQRRLQPAPDVSRHLQSVMKHSAGDTAWSHSQTVVPRIARLSETVLEWMVILILIAVSSSATAFVAVAITCRVTQKSLPFLSLPSLSCPLPKLEPLLCNPCTSCDCASRDDNYDTIPYRIQPCSAPDIVAALNDDYDDALSC